MANKATKKFANKTIPIILKELIKNLFLLNSTFFEEFLFFNLIA